MPYLHTRNDSDEGLYMYPYGAFVHNPYSLPAGPSSLRHPQRSDSSQTSAASHYPSNWGSLEDSPLGAPRTPPETYQPAFMDSWNQAHCFGSDASFHLPYPVEDVHRSIQPCPPYLTQVSNSQHAGSSSSSSLSSGNPVEFERPAQLSMRSPGDQSPTIHHPQPIRPIPIISLAALSAAEASEPKSQRSATPTPLLFQAISPSLMAQHSKHVQHGDVSRRRMWHETDYSGIQPCTQYWPLFSHM